MSSTAGSAEERLKGLSREKTRLLKLLLGKKAKPAQQIQPIPRADDGTVLTAASWAQQRLWFIDQLEGGSAAYHRPVVMRLQGSLDVDALRKTLDTLVQRHEALRTVFIPTGDGPYQKVGASGSFHLQSLDSSEYDEERREAEINRHKAEEAHTPFDLSCGPLIRGRLLRVQPDVHVLLITLHHIVSDGWSIGVLIRELGELYAAYANGSSDPLRSLPIQYADYAHWQRDWLRGEELERQLNYWRERMQGAPPQLQLPMDRPRPPLQSYRGDIVRVVLDSALTARVRASAQRNALTLFMAMYVGWAVLLSRLSGQESVVLGMPIANRQRPELEGLIGFFSNTLVLRLEVGSDVSVESIFRQVKEVTLGAFDHQDVPFEKVVEALHPDRSLSRNPLFQSMFVWQNAPKCDLQLPGLTITQEEAPEEYAMFDLLLSLEEKNDEVVGYLNFATDLMDKSTVERWVESFKVVLERMAADDQFRSIGELPILPESERLKVVDSFNATRLAHDSKMSLVHRLFEDQVRRLPTAVALRFEESSLTYSEINAKANQLAHYLFKKGVGPGALVGICVERSPDMVVGLLGILKAGAAYVPLDPNYPIDRLHYMLEDAAPQAILIQEKLRPLLPATQSAVISLDTQRDEIADCDDQNFSAIAEGSAAKNRAYVIYTSGSTGKPKGTAMEHGALVNLIDWHRSQFTSEEQTRVLQFAALSFDVAFQEIFSTLCTGGTIMLLNEWIRRDPRALAQFLRDHRVERLFIPPLMLESLAQCSQGGFPESLRDVITAGEQLRINSEVREFFAGISGCRLHNHYGPTETHVVTALTLSGDASDWPALPSIGRPISNSRIYILDSRIQPVPIGVIGEIYIGGVGVARGYLNRPELTAGRFVADPFGTGQQRLYRTGDLGRWAQDGTIEFLGRNDHQVKIRGFRVELGEIQSLLARHAKVNEAVVISREDSPGEKRLVAYFTQREQTGVSTEELRSYLKASLPDYMVPSAFVVLENIPLTPNGKLDTRGLPVPDSAAYVTKKYEAPSGEIEETVAGIWQKLLRVERVGRNDNFFELGGHSFLIVQLKEQLRKVGLSAELRSIYESSTLADLASTLSSGTFRNVEVPPNGIPSNSKTITPQMLTLVDLEPQHIERIVELVPGGAENVKDIYPLTPLQEGLFFHYLLNERGGDVYVVSTVLSMPSRQKLDEFIHAMQAVVDRHDILRTAVLWERLPQPIQVVYRKADLPVDEISLDAETSVTEQIRKWIEPARQRIDLRRAPLMRLQIAEDARSGTWYALLLSHHLTLDHDSMDIMFSEVMCHLEGRGHQLPTPVPYRNHIAHALAHAKASDAKQFFRGKLAGIDEPTAPFGILDVYGDGSRKDTTYETLDPELARRARAQARRLAISVATLFHATWALVLSRTSGREEVVFGTLLSGRLQGATGGQQVLGMFINTLPVRLSLRAITAGGLVEYAQRELVALLNHEQTSLADAQRCSDIVGNAPLFSTLLNYRHGSVDRESRFANAGVTLITVESSSNYPVAFGVIERGEEFLLDMETDPAIGAQRMLEYVSITLSALLDALEHAPNTRALQLPVLPTREWRQLVHQFNATQAPYPIGPIHQVFEDHARRTPLATAVSYEGQSLNYAQLNAKANQFARYLRSLGVEAGELVPIRLPRCLQMIVTQLAVLKCGAACVALDPDLPAERQLFIAKDCGARRIVTDQRRHTDFAGDRLQWIACSDATGAMEKFSTENLGYELHPSLPAYLIYTSGSSGVPKGVVVPHHAVNRLVINNGYAQVNAQDCVTHGSNPAFDASLFEVWGALLNGARLLIVSPSTLLDGRHLVRVVAEENVTVLFLTTALFVRYADLLTETPARLRYILFGGDVVEPNAVQRVLQQGGPRQLVNCYGPTECTTISTTYAMEAVEDNLVRVPVGRPMSNATIYVLSSGLHPVPVGVTGEVYIGGAGVALGYLNRRELTAERFIADPFSAEPGARMYRSGDLGQWRADGNLEFVGRNDHQVKIRGFRIELGEMEAQLARHEGVKEASVLARKDDAGEKSLVAYIVPRDGSVLNVEMLRAYMKSVLPEYMVPSAFILLESFPLTTNGKIDRRALPAPELGAYVTTAYEAPDGEVERALAEMWKRLLRVERVGRRDSFFELGGHSLHGVKLIGAIAEQFDVSLSAVAIFQYPTIREMAAVVDSLRWVTPEPLLSDEEQVDEGAI